MSEVIGGIVDSSLSRQKLKEAHTALDQFIGGLQGMLSSLELEQDDDIDHIKVGISHLGNTSVNDRLSRR